MGSDTFIAAVAPIARRLWDEGSHIFPSVRIAQALHETNAQLHTWNNLTGMKAVGPPTPYWSGTCITKGTWEVVKGSTINTDEAFRAYDSIEQCFRDHDRLMRTERYKAVWDAKTPIDQIVALLRCGYATDPNYHAKIINNWWRPLHLAAYDPPVSPIKLKGVGIPMQLDQTEWQALYEALNAMYHDSVDGKIAPVLNDYTYAGKAAEKIMNSDELLVCLTTVIAKALQTKGV